MVASLPTPGLREWRCRRCKRLLLRHAVTVGTIEVLCERPRCKTLNVLVAGESRAITPPELTIRRADR